VGVSLLATILAATPPTGGALPFGSGNQPISLLEYVRAGGPLGYVLLTLSVIALGLILRNLYLFRIAKLAPTAVSMQLSRLLRDGDIEGARRYCQDPQARSLLTGMFRSAIDRCLRTAPSERNVRAIVEESGANAIGRLHRLNNPVGIIAAVGPMLGLLGTVIGMIGAFHSIGALEGAARSTQLARFMSLALVNTAEGLIVAIPCTVIFSMFRQRIDRLAGEVGEIADSIAADLSVALDNDLEQPADRAPQKQLGAAVS
jgi:biopolymer transport protein ExbB